MKCSKCGAVLPEGASSCARCGANVDTTTGLDLPGAPAVNQRLIEYLPRLGVGKFVEVRPGLHIGQKGSTHVEVRVVQAFSQVAVRSLSPVTVGTPITQDLLQFLLRENASLLFGAFGLGAKNEILFSHTIMATSMDIHELKASVSTVITMADKYDDQIVQQWGGKTAKQTAIEDLLAPALVKALARAAQAPAESASTAPTGQPGGDGTDESQPGLLRAGVPDVSEAIAVGSVPEEYVHLTGQRCSCGGRFDLDARDLLQIENRMYDLVYVSCRSCGKEKQLLFDINSFFRSE